MKLLQGEAKLNYGAIYENLAAQEHYCHGFGGDEHELHYFNSKKQGEVDFVISHNGSVIPIEVKPGKDYERHSVLTNDNLHVEDKRIYMPIYMLMFIQKSPTPASQIFKFDLQNL